jgi:hypothetical protein
MRRSRRPRARLSLASALLASALALLPGAGAEGSPLMVVSQSGDSAPSSSVWQLQLEGDYVQLLNQVHWTGIANDLGFAVWEIDDDATAAGIRYQTYELGNYVVALLLQEGWILRARVRVVAQSVATPAAGGSAGIAFGSYSDSSRPTLLFGAEDAASGGDLLVRAPDAGVEVQVAGGSVYHLVEMVYRPPGPGFDVFVDGVERISDVPIGTLDPSTASVIFGSLQGIAGTSQVRYERIELQVLPKDCEDGLDNDGDGLVDDQDPGCTGPADPSELDAFACNNGLDDDGDGLIDMDDPGCTRPGDDIEFDFSAGTPAFDAEVRLRFELGQTLPPFELTTVGVAPVHAPGGPLQYIGIPALAGVDHEPMSTPNGILTAAELHAALPAGTLAAGTSHPIDALPVAGFLRLLLPPYSDDYPLSGSYGAALGAGGSWSLGSGDVEIRMTAAPWTLGSAVAQSEIASSAPVTVSRQGFVHGPLSGTSTAAQTSGVVQFVTPLQVKESGVPGVRQQAAFGTLRIHFIPEPAPAALLGAGALLLAELGRRRAAARARRANSAS